MDSSGVKFVNILRYKGSWYCLLCIIIHAKFTYSERGEMEPGSLAELVDK